MSNFGWRRTEGVRFTHIPTGTVAQSRDCAPRRGKWSWYHRQALALLRSRLAAPRQAGIVRTYDLNPPCGIEPNIRQEGRWLATGATDVQAFLDGEIDRA